MKFRLIVTVLLLVVAALALGGCIDNTMRGVGSVLQGVGTLVQGAGTDIQNACENSNTNYARR